MPHTAEVTNNLCAPAEKLGVMANFSEPLSSGSSHSSQDVQIEDWYSEYYGDLIRYGMSRVGNLSLVEDLVQETFLAVLRSSSRFEGRSSIVSWLIAILRNKICDHFRQQNRWQAVDFDGFSTDPQLEKIESTAGHPEIPTFIFTDPETLIERKQAFSAIVENIGLLPNKFRDVMLAVLREQTTEEICQELNISKSNTWVTLHRGRKLLKQSLQSSNYNSLFNCLAA